ncbi:MAG: hypothetical protein FD168_1601 [Desulfobulbaceae bacterium]|nr:MAG: hypothetical protein FD168_1601 [Desulfobulbaceae bacterium]
MIENKRALPLNRLDGPESALNIKQDNNSPTQKKQSCWFYILAISAMAVALKIHRVLRRGI